MKSLHWPFFKPFTDGCVGYIRNQILKVSFGCERLRYPKVKHTWGLFANARNWLLEQWPTVPCHTTITGAKRLIASTHRSVGRLVVNRYATSILSKPPPITRFDYLIATKLILSKKNKTDIKSLKDCIVTHYGRCTPFFLLAASWFWKLGPMVPSYPRDSAKLYV